MDLWAWGGLGCTPAFCCARVAPVQLPAGRDTCWSSVSRSGTRTRDESPAPPRSLAFSSLRSLAQRVVSRERAAAVSALPAWTSSPLTDFPPRGARQTQNNTCLSPVRLKFPIVARTAAPWLNGSESWKETLLTRAFSLDAGTSDNELTLSDPLALRIPRRAGWSRVCRLAPSGFARKLRRTRLQKAADAAQVYHQYRLERYAAVALAAGARASRLTVTLASSCRARSVSFVMSAPHSSRNSDSTYAGRPSMGPSLAGARRSSGDGSSSDSSGPWRAQVSDDARPSESTSEHAGDFESPRAEVSGEHEVTESRLGAAGASTFQRPGAPMCNGSAHHRHAQTWRFAPTLASAASPVTLIVRPTLA